MLTINDVDAFKNFFYQARFHAADFNKDLLKQYNLTRTKYYYGDINPTTGQFEESFIRENSIDNEQDLKYFIQMLESSNSGVSIMEADATYTNFTKVSINNNTIQRTPCN